MLNNKSRRTPQTTMESFSGSSKYTETFFHHPSPNPHSKSVYESKNGKQPIKAFRTKGKADFQSLMHESSLNPFSRNRCHYEPKMKVAGDHKRIVQPFSGKPTDPILMSYEPNYPRKKIAKDFSSTIDYKKDIERKSYLPIQRQFSRSNRKYHSQLGLSLSARESVTPRSGLNVSNHIKSTIQYTQHRQMTAPCFFDNLKYSSKK